MSIRVLMLPQMKHFRSEESGIKRVIEAYYKYLPGFGIELVDDAATSYDVKAVHAGMSGPDCDVAHLHGLYWTADYDAAAWEYEANSRIVEALRHAKEVTVPSAWVSETFQRDMRFSPHVIGHGVEWQDWQHSEPCEGYVLWNKNRIGDVCNPDALAYLAQSFEDTHFISTFGPKLANTTIFNTTINHRDMKRLIQRAGVYLSSTKETFGIGVLEAMAAGVPVLGWRHGGNVELVQHGVNGYLATPYDYEDLAEGLVYCLKHRATLGANGRALAKGWTWEAACEQVAGVYRLAMEPEPATVSVVIPVYNKTEEQVRRAVESCLAQTLKPEHIIVIDDGSDEKLGERYKALNDIASVWALRQDNQGVAIARNNGIAATISKYVCCLDADDWIEPAFLGTCVEALEADRSLGIAYTSLRWHKPGGETGVPDWPPNNWDFDKQLQRQNQVPTCCVFRRRIWQRLGGYRQRYAPDGAGAEDAEFWTRAGAYGWKAVKAAYEPLFNYSLGGSVSGNPDYREPDWLAWHPWSYDGLHPLASYATPRRQSHPVRQYDEPVISVVIPVGPGHERDVINALDSLEAQTFRKWEAVVVDDTGTIPQDKGAVTIEKEIGWIKELLTAYPYTRFDTNVVSSGAGVARNRGVEIARAPLLLFLDADDTLHPLALEKMLAAWNETGKAIYTDYVGQAFISEEFAVQLEREKRLQSYNPKDGEAIISYQAYDFDCGRALRQPEGEQPYIWNLITTLIPKVWHEEIGGFDEGMETWEDWDYWLRIARAGHCFHRLGEALVRYRFYTGGRRLKALPDSVEGRQTAEKMIEYLKDKYRHNVSVDMGCGCGKKNGAGPGAVMMASQTLEVGARVADNDFVKARYLGPRGNHHVIGAREFDFDPGVPSRRKGSNWVIYYGYISQGRELLVHKDDVRLMTGKWQPVQEQVELPAAEKVATPAPALIGGAEATVVKSTAPKPQLWGDEVEASDSDEPFDLQTIPGVTAPIAKNLEKAGLTTPAAIRAAGYEGLLEIKGIAEARAKAIMAAVQKET